MDGSWKIHSCRSIRTEDTFETESVGWTNSAWTGEEIYAMHKGLVYYKRKISDDMTLEFE
jgi:hypothetical protein